MGADRAAAPAAAGVSGGNRNDVTYMIPLLQAVPPIRGKGGRPRRRPDRDWYRRQVRALGIIPVVARRGTEHGSGLGIHRWVAEAAFTLLRWFRRLRIRWATRSRRARAASQPGSQHVDLAAWRGRVEAVIDRDAPCPPELLDAISGMEATVRLQVIEQKAQPTR